MSYLPIPCQYLAGTLLAQMVQSYLENRKWSGAILIGKATCVPNRPWCHVLLARLPPNNGFPPSACCPVCTTLMLLNRQVVYRAEWILSGTNAEEIWRFSQFRNNRCRLKNIQLSIAPYLNFTWPILSNQKPNKNRKKLSHVSHLFTSCIFSNLLQISNE